jgi:hypothetical protein
MTVAGPQVYAMGGWKGYFRRIPEGGQTFPLVDMGTISDNSPELETELVPLFDPGETGFNRKVAEALARVDEAHVFTLHNFNKENMALAFLAKEPEEFSQLAETHEVEHFLIANRLLKIQNAAGHPLYSLSGFGGFIAGDHFDNDIEQIDRDSKTITVATGGPLEGSPTPEGLAVGESIIIGARGLSDLRNAGTYTIASVAGFPNIVVEEDFFADELFASPGPLGQVFVASTEFGVLPRSAWDIPTGGLDRGIVRIKDPATISETGLATAIFGTKARSGKLLVRPQSGTGPITADVWLYFTMQNGRVTVRQGRAQITPTGMSFSATEWSSFNLRVTFISDVTEVHLGIGELLTIVGDALPLS